MGHERWYTAVAREAGATNSDMADERIAEQRLAAPLSAEATLPDSDGRPLAENDEHYRAILSIRAPLEVRFRDSADTYVTGDLLLYYDREDRRKCAAPDVLVARGLAKRFRRSYVLWEEGKPPDCVVEVSSPDSRTKDRTKKRKLYAKLGVREYFLFDPVYEDSQHEGRLQGFRLWGGRSMPMGPGGVAGSRAELESEVLGVSLRPEGKRVRLRDLRSGEDLLYFDETEDARQAATQAQRLAETQRNEETRARQLAETQRDEESGARRAAEARVAELEAMLRGSSALPRSDAAK